MTESTASESSPAQNRLRDAQLLLRRGAGLPAGVLALIAGLVDVTKTYPPLPVSWTGLVIGVAALVVVVELVRSGRIRPPAGPVAQGVAALQRPVVAGSLPVVLAALLVAGTADLVPVGLHLLTVLWLAAVALTVAGLWYAGVFSRATGERLAAALSRHAVGRLAVGLVVTASALVVSRLPNQYRPGLGWQLAVLLLVVATAAVRAVPTPALDRWLAAQLPPLDAAAALHLVLTALVAGVTVTLLSLHLAPLVWLAATLSLLVEELAIWHAPAVAGARPVLAGASAAVVATAGTFVALGSMLFVWASSSANGYVQGIVCAPGDCFGPVGLAYIPGYSATTPGRGLTAAVLGAGAAVLLVAAGICARSATGRGWRLAGVGAAAVAAIWWVGNTPFGHLAAWFFPVGLAALVLALGLPSLRGKPTAPGPASATPAP
ncbi:MAG: hypothetical protein ACYDB7_12635 [Mycobacteriales bacterium]